ncbi:MAG: hypothetical protein SOV79_05525 [Eisenbergiella porci]|uniref:hypothetical protein n=1 Tax=Eisenbergiella TaxID=1432051 RepID=UPI0018A6D040|nr:MULTISPECIES: hypothetical protein [Eisenbergiella]MCI6706998.1 hypothetical protein [Eisenbergiella massiliensis]MDY2652042.1 hypothetical protein [Eisenbergiella porci]
MSTAKSASGLIGKRTADSQKQSRHRQNGNGKHKTPSDTLQNTKNLVFHFSFSPFTAADRMKIRGEAFPASLAGREASPPCSVFVRMHGIYALNCSGFAAEIKKGHQYT